MVYFSHVRPGRLGFTVVEVITAISILTIGIVAVVSAAIYSNNVAKLGAQRVVAAHLAEEGIELVRNIRDSNYVSGGAWNASIGAGDYVVQYLLTAPSNPLSGKICRVVSGNVSCPTTLAAVPNLVIDGNGFYGYQTWPSFSGSTATPYKRIVNITQPNVFSMVVKSTVSWSSSKGTQQVILQELLYDWRPPPT